jgi:hypothetical protein
MLRFSIFLAAAVTFVCSLASAAETAPLPAFHAEYDVLRNGKTMGKATLDLHQAQGDNWEFINQTKGTSGLAALAGIDVREVSTFRWRNGLPESLQYQYTQKSALKTRQRGIVFDWNKKSAASHDGNQQWTVALKPGSVDRNLAVLAVAADLKRGSKTLSYPVLDSDMVADKVFAIKTTETLDLPAGKLSAIRVERERNDNPHKHNTSWHAAERGFLPVQIEQQDKGDTITMKLVALQSGK